MEEKGNKTVISKPEVKGPTGNPAVDGFDGRVGIVLIWFKISTNGEFLKIWQRTHGFYKLLNLLFLKLPIET
jgi:hypothetical protein